MTYLDEYYLNLIDQEFHNRFNPDEEYLGRNKPVNQLKPVVSVVVSTYQHKPFIRECITSILNQETDFQYEILIGEDGSNDGTREICKELADLHPERIRLFLRDRNTSQFYDSDGNYVARFNVNWLRKSSRGDFIALCEGDDYWIDPNKLQKQVEALQNHTDCSFCFHPAKIEYFDLNKENKITGFHFQQVEKIEIGDMIVGGGHYCPTASVMFNKEVNTKILASTYIHLFPVIDYYVQVLALTQGRGLYLPDVMSVYRFGVPGSWNQTISSILKRVEHMISMMISNRFFDKKLGYKYHPSFRKKEKRDIRYTFKYCYSYKKEEIDEIKKMVSNHTSGILYMKCRWEMFLSYLYFRLGFKHVALFLRKIKAR
jgi:glycosyltransferase involved in cell wall biosynthesis